MESDPPKQFPMNVPEAARKLALSPRLLCCFFGISGGRPPDRELRLHSESQDVHCDAWHELQELIEKTARDGLKEFEPVSSLGLEKYRQIVELPPSIAKLKSVKVLSLYGSSLVRIPPEVGEMASLREFDPYTSMRLHWFPFEILRCKNLISSRVSTRALYGNYKYRPPFPRLPQDPCWMSWKTTVESRCSVCSRSVPASTCMQAWISLRVATDVLPLLVHACSQKCLESLPTPAERYVQRAHQGGLDLEQPPRW